MAESLVLQRIMFLAPEPELSFEWHLNMEDGAYEDPYMYTKEQSGIVSELERGDQVFASSQVNPLLFERRPGTVTGNMNETRYPFYSPRFYPRRLWKDIGAGRLFSRMLIAQPPVTFAYVGCNTIISNSDGIRVSDMVHAMKVEDGYVCELGHVFSFVVSRVMFPIREEEKEGQMIRQYTTSEKHCNDCHQKDGRFQIVRPDGNSESGYIVRSIMLGG